MDSSALPSEAQIQKLEYHALRTLARVHGLKATGKREEIRERLLQWRAEFGPERNLVGHDVDNEGAASSSGSNTKENVGAHQETTVRKRKAEEMDPKTAPQSKKILTESNILNTDVAPPTPSTPPPTALSPSLPSQPLPPLPSSSPLPLTSLTPPPPFPPQCPGIRQFPQPAWNAMFFTPDPSGWPCTVRPVSDWANVSSEKDYSDTPDDDSDIE